MLNFFKWAFFIKIIRSNGKNLVALAMLIFFLLTVPLIFKDIINLVDSSSRLNWVLAKWTILLLLMVSVWRVSSKLSVRFRGIFNKNAKRKREVVSEIVIVDKQQVLDKTKLLSKGDRIKSKYGKSS